MTERWLEMVHTMEVRDKFFLIMGAIAIAWVIVWVLPKTGKMERWITIGLIAGTVITYAMAWILQIIYT